MMIGLLAEVFSTILAEGRLEQVKQKYPNVDPKIIDHLSDNDPSGNNKYLMWMAKMYVQEERGRYKPATILDLVDDFHKYAKMMSKKDINQYASTGELAEALDAYEKERDIKLAKKRKEKMTKAKVSGGVIIYEDERYVVVHPTTQDAVCFHGAGTQWCITMRDAGHYENYLAENVVFYFIIDLYRKSNDPFYKVAIAVHRSRDNDVVDWEAYDAPDDNIGFDDMRKEYGDKAQEFLNLVKQDASERPTNEGVEENWEEKIQELEEHVDELNAQSSLLSASVFDEHIEDMGDGYLYRIDVSGYIDLSEMSETIYNALNELSYSEGSKLLNDIVQKRFEYVSFIDVDNDRVYFSIEDQDLTDSDIEHVKDAANYHFREAEDVSLEDIYSDIEESLVKEGHVENWLKIDDIENIGLEKFEIDYRWKSDREGDIRENGYVVELDLGAIRDAGLLELIEEKSEVLANKVLEDFKQKVEQNLKQLFLPGMEEEGQEMPPLPSDAKISVYGSDVYFTFVFDKSHMENFDQKYAYLKAMDKQSQFVKSSFEKAIKEI